MTQDQIDAKRYRWLKTKLKFHIGRHEGPDFLRNATRSHWFLDTMAVFVGTNKEPESMDTAIDEAMEAVERGNAHGQRE